MRRCFSIYTQQFRNFRTDEKTVHESRRNFVETCIYVEYFQIKRIIKKELVEAVKTRGVEFVLLEEDKTSLRKTGANDLLIKALFESLTAEFKQKLKKNCIHCRKCCRSNKTENFVKNSKVITDEKLLCV